MGIDGLWKILEPISEKRSFREYALTQSLQRGNGVRISPIIVGIDASIWMNESQAAFHHRRHAQMGENPELRTLFYRLSHLLEISIVPVFIFDGPHRPSKKRGRKVITQPHWLTERLKEMIKIFGFYHHTARGEAEAELAALNRLGFLDAVMTEDSDSFVFGATCVIRKSDDKGKSDHVRIYTAEQAKQRLGMGQNDFIFMAILCGGDYDKAGLVGCGTAVASQLTNLQIGDTLCNAAHLPDHEMEEAFQNCRSLLRKELATNSSGFLRRRHSRLAATVPDTFPSVDTLRRYVSPTLTNLKFLDTISWVPQMPIIESMFMMCEELFSWGTADGILKKFKSVVWTGVCFRQIIQYQCDNDIEVIVLPTSCFLRVRKPTHSRKEEHIKTFDVDVDISSVIFSSLKHLRYSRQSVSATNETQLIHTYGKFTAKLPMVMVRYGLPNLAQELYLVSRSRGYPSLDTASAVHEVIDLTG